MSGGIVAAGDGLLLAYLVVMIEEIERNITMISALEFRWAPSFLTPVLDVVDHPYCWVAVFACMLCVQKLGMNANVFVDF